MASSNVFAIATALVSGLSKSVSESAIRRGVSATGRVFGDVVPIVGTDLAAVIKSHAEKSSAPRVGGYIVGTIAATILSRIAPEDKTKVFLSGLAGTAAADIFWRADVKQTSPTNPTNPQDNQESGVVKSSQDLLAEGLAQLMQAEPVELPATGKFVATSAKVTPAQAVSILRYLIHNDLSTAPGYLDIPAEAIARWTPKTSVEVWEMLKPYVGFEKDIYAFNNNVLLFDSEISMETVARLEGGSENVIGFSSRNSLATRGEELL